MNFSHILDDNMRLPNEELLLNQAGMYPCVSIEIEARADDLGYEF